MPRKPKTGRIFNAAARAKRRPKTLDEAQIWVKTLTDSQLAKVVDAGGGESWSDFAIWSAALWERDARLLQNGQPVAAWPPTQETAVRKGIEIR